MKSRAVTRCWRCSAHISRVALLQIDTINVVARSYLVLFSRLGSYPFAGGWIGAATRQVDGILWAHEACFLPRRYDFKLIRHRNAVAPEKMGWEISRGMVGCIDAENNWCGIFQEHSPVRSADYEHAQKGAESG